MRSNTDRKERKEDMSQTTPGSQPDLSPLTIRETLISLLEQAADLEHSLACVHLFAAYSLKNDIREGGITDKQAEIVRGWRARLTSEAVDRMLHLAQILHLLTAIGAAPHIARPTFPLLSSTDPSRIRLLLAPFSQRTIERLSAFERSDAIITTLNQPLGIDEGLISAMTVGDLYERIAQGFRDLPTEELFIGSSEVQANARFLNLGDQLITVVDRASAAAAIAMITGTANGAVSTDTASVGTTIRTEYAAVVAEAQKTGLLFDPVRSVGTNPRAHLIEERTDSTRIVDTLTVAVADLFNRAYDTLLLLTQRIFAPTEESNAELELFAQAALRLMASVIRPLGEALTRMPIDSASLVGVCAGAPFGDDGDLPEVTHQTPAKALFDEQLWQLAIAATTLRIIPGLPTEIQEATAALQDLTCQFAPADGPDGMAARITTLKQMQAELGCTIQASVSGPYLVTNANTLVTWLGEPIPVRPQMALCRCGGSAIKPFCDGTHVRIGFTDKKDPQRVLDHSDTYIGTAITILDNRGICAHSGFCSDRLATVFHAGQEPFVSPNGARMDEIIRAVRACPSGALSYALGGVEIRDGVDQMRPPTIEVSKDGPYRITGGIALKDGQGNDETRNQGASQEHYSLCRCGHSQNKPFCSGMHWYVNFHDPEIATDREPTLFEWAGGLPALTRMTHLFYDKYVPQDPLIEPLFAHMSPDHPERVAAWLGEVFGGPKNYTQEYGGYTRMLSQHLGKGLTEERRARWASLLYQAANEAGLPNDPEFRSAFTAYIEWGSRLAVENSQPGCHPPLHMPVPHWDWGTAGAPGTRISALAPVVKEQEAVVLPVAGETVHFTQHIKPLFRQMDRQSMKWAFDLWSYQDLKTHADGILRRLQNGSMPCDGAWLPEKVEIFQRWVESGMQE